MAFDLGLTREEAIQKLEVCLVSCTECCRTLLNESLGQPGYRGQVARMVQAECQRVLTCLRSYIFTNRRRFLKVFVDVRMVERWLGGPKTLWPLKPTVRTEQERKGLGDKFTPLVTVWPKIETMAPPTDPAASDDAGCTSEWEDELVEDWGFSSEYSEQEEEGADDACKGKSQAAEKKVSGAEAAEVSYGNDSLVTAFKSLTLHDRVELKLNEGQNSASATACGSTTTDLPTDPNSRPNNGLEKISLASFVVETDTVLVTGPHPSAACPDMPSLQETQSTDFEAIEPAKKEPRLQRVMARLDKLLSKSKTL